MPGLRRAPLDVLCPEASRPSGTAWGSAAQPSAEQTSALARRVASDLSRAGWRLDRVLCDNGNEFRSHRFADQLDERRAHTGRLTRGRIPADIIDPAGKMRPRP